MSIAAPIAYRRDFYDGLIASPDAWQRVERVVVEAGHGHGQAVNAGQVIRLRMIERAQVIDLDVFSAADPTEHLHAPTQIRLEGGRVQVGTRLWGTPPRTRPLATVVADRIDHVDEGVMLRDHKCYGAHCNPHQWMLFGGFLPRTCYDNLSVGCKMVGIEPGLIHDNLNLYMKTALEPTTGKHLNVMSDAKAGDHIDFYAEIDTHFVLSLCPYGDGSIVPEDFAAVEIPTAPVAVEILDTGVAPLGCPT